MKKIVMISIVLFASLIVSGCYTTPAQRGALGGGLIGAAAGQIIGGDTESTLIGTGVGALGGALANDYVDDQKRRAYHQGYTEAQARPQSYSHRETVVYRQHHYIHHPPPPPVHYYHPPPFAASTHFHFFVD